MYMRMKKGQEWTGKLLLMGETINGYKILVGKPDRKKIFGRPSRRQEDDDKMNLEKIRHKGAGSNHMTKDKDIVTIL